MSETSPGKKIKKIFFIRHRSFLRSYVFGFSPRTHEKADFDVTGRVFWGGGKWRKNRRKWRKIRAKPRKNQPVWRKGNSICTPCSAM